jgi:hypothetical protein
MDGQFGSRRKVPHPAATSLEPLRIRVAEYRQALELSRELAEIGEVEVNNGMGVWEVCLHGPKTDNRVIRAFEAARRALNDPLASAEIRLDGHQYRLQGE